MNRRKCSEPLPLNESAQRAFAQRQLKLTAQELFPVTGWYNDEDFCRAYNTAVALRAELASLREQLAAQTARAEYAEDRLKETGQRLVELLSASRSVVSGLLRASAGNVH